MSKAARQDFARLAITQTLLKRGYSESIALMTAQTVPDDNAPEFGLFETRLEKCLKFAAEKYNQEINDLERERDEHQLKAFEIEERLEKLRKKVTEV